MFATLSKSVGTSLSDFCDRFRTVKVKVVPRTEEPKWPVWPEEKPYVSIIDEAKHLNAVAKEALAKAPAPAPLEGEIVDKGVIVEVVRDQPPVDVVDIATGAKVVHPTPRAVVAEPGNDFWATHSRRHSNRAAIKAASGKELIKMTDLPRGYSNVEIGEGDAMEKGIVHVTNRGINALVRVSADEFRTISNNGKFGGKLTVSAEAAKLFLNGRY